MKRLLLLFILFTTYLQAQDKTILVIDKQTGDPVPYANVCVEGVNSGYQNYSTTNGDGEVIVSEDGKIEISVSFIGYKNFKEIIDISNINKIELAPDIFALEQVVVTGQNIPMVKDSSIYSIKVFDSKLIQQRGAVNLGDVLSAQPSIKIKQSSTSGSNINILGLGGENVKIMIDGVPIIGRLNGNLDLSQITMENVDHIEVIEGPMSVIYGSNALAGTINIITKNNKWNKFLLSANTYVESPGTINADILASGKFGNNVVTGSFVRNYFTGTSFDDSRQSKWKGSTQNTGELKYDHYGKRYVFRTSLKYFDELMVDKGEVKGDGTPTPYAMDVNYLTKRFSGNAFLDFTHNESMQTNVQASYSYFNRVMQDVTTDLSDLNQTETASDTTSFISFMTRATFNHTINSRISYQTGIDVNTEVARAERIEDNEQNIGDYAIFITGKHHLWDKFIFQPGFRYAYNSKFSSPLLYSLNIKSDLDNGWQTRISAAKGFRAPSLKELYLDYSPGPVVLLGNPDLKPETSYSFNAATSYTFRNEDSFMIKTEMKLYYNDIYDKIDFEIINIDPSGIQTWQNANIGNIKTIGLVADIDFNLNSSWDLNLNYSRAGITSLEFSEGYTNNQFVFTNNFLTAITYKIPKYRFSVRAEYSYNGKTPARFIDDKTKKEPMVEAYNDLNLTLTKSFLKRRLNLSVGVKNIFDNTDLQYIGGQVGDNSRDSYEMLSWGRSYFLKVNFKLNTN